MKPKDFKAVFDDVAKSHGFKTAHGGWYQELSGALFVLDLQKSHFGNYYEFNLKLFLGIGPPNDPTKFKKLVKGLSGDVFRRQPEDCRNLFDLDVPLGTTERRAAIDKMFCDLVDRIVSSAGTPGGILRLRDEGVLYLLPMIEAQLKAS
jgi:hypothetical protein